MSLRRGTLLSVVLPSAIMQAARIGKALFLEPEISILPLRRLPPRMRKLSIALARPWAGSKNARRVPHPLEEDVLAGVPTLSPKCPTAAGIPGNSGGKRPHAAVIRSIGRSIGRRAI